MVLVKRKICGVHKPGTASELFGDCEIKKINENLNKALKKRGIWNQKRMDGRPIIADNSVVRRGGWNGQKKAA
jgi:hypothetical protein